ncbi:MAG: pyruvate/2-oxoglutarate/acetoin dehydrogenase E1 component/TPP-dependent pyruvate [Vicingaceae bacterium]|jgi:pyruvate/2-oxoglutarate/acetoin dehydrogenase E1 component/TPP-dependent pyruvate/acetoin dehydrogenase alpha subunit
MENATIAKESDKIALSKEEFKKTVLADYKLANVSRETSLLGRKEVLTGKAKFGIFGDGKEIPQLAMARFFENGDFRSGYYRDQTFMMSIGQLTVQQFFAQLYAHPDANEEPSSGGRSMTGHYATRSLDEKGNWKSLKDMKNSSADISPTAGQMPRLLGLAQASKIYRNNNLLPKDNLFSRGGNEVAFGTIGDSSTSEGLFWETINAAGVLQVPMVMSVWDDGHGISVPKKYQTTKESISEVLKGFQRENGSNGFEMFKVKAWDYAALMATYEKAVKIAREQHVPVLIHVEEVTQPQGHSTSGSHERYKSSERLQWEMDFDCIKKLGEWIVEKGLATQEELTALQSEAKKEVREAKKAAWESFSESIKTERDEAVAKLEALVDASENGTFLQAAVSGLKTDTDPSRKGILNVIRKAIRTCRNENIEAKSDLIAWFNSYQIINAQRFSGNLYSESDLSPLKQTEILPEYAADAEEVDGRVVLRDNFDKIFEKYPETLIFGEDSGKIGDVNQGLEGMQEKYGELRVSDTGIREATIAGQGIGMAMRGLRPIAEIQYLDYLLYCLQIMSDDLATLQYRSAGGQKAPLIVRTRGHRLEGIWHSGSPMGVILNAIKGIHVCVPRNLTTAAGFYNTLLKGDDPALVIEPLNAYRSKEKMPSNLGEFQIELGVPEVVAEGTDITIVTYGSTCNLAEEAVKELNQLGISAELIDVRTLMPFDKNHSIVESLKKTNKVLFLDEDVKGGGTAYMMQKVLEEQGGYYHLDVEPKTLSAKDHRPAYGTDGDYFSKPSVDDMVETCYAMMRDSFPDRFPALY